MNYKRTTMWLAIALLLASLVAACGQSSLEIGMVETRLPGRWQASYVTFTGTKVDTIQAQAGQTLMLEYDVQVDKGDLSMEVSRDDREAVWDMSFQEDAKDAVEVALDQDGPYTISLAGDNAGGSFDLSWALR
jgi:hypothetical protein